jgi:pimeloyl-ACP methyl ester carboxylesterase
MRDAFSKRTAVTIHGNIIHIRSSISNKPTSIILVHGLGTSSDSYIRYARLLSKDYDVYCIDLPGYGKTPKPSKTLSLKEMAFVVDEFVRTTIRNECIIVGHSMGCQVVAYCVTDAANLYSKAILLSPTINNRERSLFKQSLRLTQDVMKESPQSNFVVFTNYIRMGFIRYAKTLRIMLHDPIETRLQANTIPVLFVRGSRDPVVPTKWVQLLSSVTPYSQQRLIHDAPHLVQFEKATELATVTGAFIKS